MDYSLHERELESLGLLVELILDDQLMVLGIDGLDVGFAECVDGVPSNGVLRVVVGDVVGRE